MMYNIIIGMDMMFISLFGLILNSVLGMNSATSNTSNVEMMVWHKRIVKSLVITSGKTLIITGLSSFAIAMP